MQSAGLADADMATVAEPGQFDVARAQILPIVCHWLLAIINTSLRALNQIESQVGTAAAARDKKIQKQQEKTCRVFFNGRFYIYFIAIANWNFAYWFAFLQATPCSCPQFAIFVYLNCSLLFIF